MNVVNMNYLDIKNRLRELINQGVPIPYDGIGPEEMTCFIDLIGIQNMNETNMNNYIDQKQKALTDLWTREGIAPLNRMREWISHPYIPGNQSHPNVGPLGIGHPVQTQTSTLQDPFQTGRDFLNTIFQVPEPSKPSENFVDVNSISYKMKDALSYNEYLFLSNLKIVEISDKKDIIKTIELLQRLIDKKVFDIPTVENVKSLIDIALDDCIKNEDAGLIMKVIMDGDDKSTARFTMIDKEGHEVELPPGQSLPDPSTITIVSDIEAIGEFGISYEIIHK